MASDVDQSTETARVAREYFQALGRAERDAQLRYYAADAAVDIHGVTGAVGRDEMIAFFAALFDAFPDWRFEILEIVSEGERAAVRWHARGTFAGPANFMGFEPNGARIDLEGVDMVRVRDGRIVAIDAY